MRTPKEEEEEERGREQWNPMYGQVKLKTKTEYTPYSIAKSSGQGTTCLHAQLLFQKCSYQIEFL